MPFSWLTDPVSRVLGGAISGVGEIFSTGQSRDSASENRAFQNEMSSTAYQRAMSDMRAAGLNPILAAKLGGASTPGGAQYTAGNVGRAIMEGYGQTARSQSDISSASKMRAEEENVREVTKRTKKEVERLVHLIDLDISKTELNRILESINIHKNNELARDSDFQTFATDVFRQLMNRTDLFSREQIKMFRAGPKSIDQVISAVNSGIKAGALGLGAVSTLLGMFGVRTDKFTFERGKTTRKSKRIGR